MLTGRSPLVMTKDRHIRQQKERFLNVPSMPAAEVSAPIQVFELVTRMMSLDPHHRYQNPTQLLEAVRVARKAAEGRATHKVDPPPTEAPELPPTESNPELGAAPPPDSGKPAICLVEKHPQLQELLREKLTTTGYEVILEDNPARASEQFRQRPFAAVVIDAAGVGPEAVVEFEQLMANARRQQLRCGGILILAEKQAAWAERVSVSDTAVVMVRPVTLKQLYQKLIELAPLADGKQG
jgi:hypothetical protein